MTLTVYKLIAYNCKAERAYIYIYTKNHTISIIIHILVIVIAVLVEKIYDSWMIHSFFFFQ